LSDRNLTDPPRPITVLTVVVGPPAGDEMHERLAEIVASGCGCEPDHVWVDFIEEVLIACQTPTSDRENFLDFLLSDAVGRPVHCQQVDIASRPIGDSWLPILQFTSEYTIDESGRPATDLFEDPAAIRGFALDLTQTLSAEWIHATTRPTTLSPLGPAATTWKRS
jgi:hypothetical protein